MICPSQLDTISEYIRATNKDQLQAHFTPQIYKIDTISWLLQCDTVETDALRCVVVDPKCHQSKFIKFFGKLYSALRNQNNSSDSFMISLKIFP